MRAGGIGADFRREIRQGIGDLRRVVGAVLRIRELARTVVSNFVGVVVEVVGDAGLGFSGVFVFLFCVFSLVFAVANRGAGLGACNLEDGVAGRARNLGCGTCDLDSVASDDGGLEVEFFVFVCGFEREIVNHGSHCGVRMQ